LIRGTHRAKDDRNGFALAAQSGQSLGRPSNNTTSQVTAYNGLPWLIPPEHPEPDHQIIELDPAPTRSPRDVIPDNNRIEWDHGRLKARLRPMRGLRTDRTASTVIRGHAFVQNLRRGHYELGVDARHEHLRLAAAFDELATAV
jgi:hypothetical protein